MHPRRYLPPVQPHELLGEIDGVQRQRLSRVVTALDGQVSKRQQQRELVRRDEAPVGEQALDVEEEVDLPFGIGGRHPDELSV